MTLQVVPVSFDFADRYVTALHRHNLPSPRMSIVYNLGVCDDDGLLRGVANVGRPVARALCDGYTLEILRTCTDGAANANSMLYGAAWRLVRAAGYHRLVTYTQQAETGASLRAAGFTRAACLPARPGWNRRTTDAPYDSTARWRWEIRTSARPDFMPRLPSTMTYDDGGLFDLGDEASA